MLQKCSIGCQDRQQMLTVNERHMALQVGLIRMYSCRQKSAYSNDPASADT